MAIPQLAMAAGRAAVSYAPAVYDKAKDLLTKATGGKVSSPEQIVSYVGKSQQRMTVVADALIRSGVSAEDIFPVDIVRLNPALQVMREAALVHANAMKQQFEAGADKALPAHSASDDAADVIRLKRVNAALRVFGTEEDYFLCLPNGGIPASDFAYARAMKKALWSTSR